MFVPVPVLILGGVAVALGLVAWVVLRGRRDGAGDLMGGNRGDLLAPPPTASIYERARAQGFDDAAARRIEARGGDDRYEMPGTGLAAPAVAAPDGGFVDLTDELREAIRAALRSGHVIPAVKLVRDRTGLGLKESKDLVDRVRQGDATVR